MTREQLFELFKSEMFRIYPNITSNQHIQYLFDQIMETNQFRLATNSFNFLENSQSQISFMAEEYLPRGEKEHYFNQNYNNNNNDFNNIFQSKIMNLIFDDEGARKILSISTETTIKDALQIYFKKYKSNDNIENYDFYSGPKRLDINSAETIGKKFTNNSLITVNEIRGLMAG